MNDNSKSRIKKNIGTILGLNYYIKRRGASFGTCPPRKESSSLNGGESPTSSQQGWPRGIMKWTNPRCLCPTYTPAQRPRGHTPSLLLNPKGSQWGQVLLYANHLVTQKVEKLILSTHWTQRWKSLNSSVWKPWKIMTMSAGDTWIARIAVP